MNKRRSVAVAAGLLLLAYIAACGLQFESARLLRHWEHGPLERAARLDPLNADPWRRLAHLDYFGDQNFERAAADEQQSLRRNPLDPDALLELALFEQSLGDSAAQRRAALEAVHADPTGPLDLLRAATALADTGDFDDAFAQLKKVAANDSELAPAAIDMAWRSRRDPEAVMRGVLAGNPAGELRFLSLLAEEGEDAAAQAVWSQIEAEKSIPDPALAFPYEQRLLVEGRGQAALEVWERLAVADPALSGYRQPGNMITNPGFEQDFLGDGLDWRHEYSPGVTVTLDVSHAHGGMRSLKLEFSGAVDQTGVAQLVPVRPGASYELGGFYRCLDLEGAGGLLWQLEDAADSRVLGQTEFLSAGEGWQPISATFQSSGELVVLRLARLPAGDQLRGACWFDDLWIREISPGGSR